MRLALVPFEYDRGGDAFGYHTMRERLTRALEQAGVVFDSRAPVALHICSPGVFGRTLESRAALKRKLGHGRRAANVLFSMWESLDFIEGELERCAHADLILTPNRWCTELFAVRTHRPVATVNLGVDPIPYRARVVEAWGPERPFRWLLVGATNPRKGLPNLAGAWGMYFAENTACTLTIKSTFPRSVEQRIAETGEADIVASLANITHDARNVPRPELEAIYDAADAFVLPTMGEGWSFPALEALSAGLPCVFTACQGLLEYADPDVATMLPWQWRAIGSRKDSQMSDGPDGRFRYAYVHPDVIGAAMLDVMQHYERACQRARLGAWRAREFTWERSAAGMLQTLVAWGGRRAA